MHRATGEEDDHGPSPRAGLHGAERRDGMPKKERSTLQQTRSFLIRGVKSGIAEDVALTNVLRSPGLRRELEDLRLVEVGVLVLGHPAGIVQKRGSCIRPHRVPLPELRLDFEVTAELLQKDDVRPA